MALVNEYYDKGASRGDIKVLLSLLSPFAPHIAEELWEIQGFEGMACEAQWPEYDENKTVDQEKEMAVQINAKLRATIVVPADSEDALIVETALANDKVKKFVEGMKVIKTIVVKNRLVNLIVKPE